MGKGINKLSATQVANATAGKHIDGMGLHLEVTKTLNKKWMFRFTQHRRRREIQLGAYPDVSLKKARVTRDKNRARLAKGKKPMSFSEWKEQKSVKKTRKKAKSQPVLFTSAAAQFIRAKRRGWKNRKHAHQWVNTLKTYARPVIGDKPVNDITTEDILQILTPIWATKTETAKRIQTRIENVLDYSAAKGHRDALNPARWRGHLDKLLMTPADAKRAHRAKTGRPENQPAMPYEEVPGFMAELRSMNGNASLALQLLILTACRTREVLEAQWNEFDGDIWTIPSERMKAGKEHQVPLSPEALAVVERMPRLKNNPYVFAGKAHRRPLSNMAMLTCMRKMGFSKTGDRDHYVPHGFRSSFRDWSGEVSNYPRDVCEMALAHAIEDKTEAAYRRGSLLLKRRHMMNDWARYATKTTSGKPIGLSSM